MKRFHGRIARVCSLVYSPDGSTLFSAGWGGLIRKWDVARGREILRFRHDEYRISDIALSPDGATLASAHAFGPARLWAAEDGNSLGQIQTPGYNPISASFRPDGRALLLPTVFISMGLWDLESRRSIARFTIPMSFHCARFSPDGSRVAIGSHLASIQFWDPSTEPEASSADEGRSSISQKTGSRSLAFSPDGRLLAATLGWSAVVYELPSGATLATLRGHRQMVNSVDVSLDGRTVATASIDGTVRFWDLISGEERACFDWEMGVMTCVKFAPDGMTVAAGGEGGIVVWDVE